MQSGVESAKSLTPLPLQPEFLAAANQVSCKRRGEIRVKAFRTGREMLSDKPWLRRVAATVLPRAVVSVGVRTVGPLYTGIAANLIVNTAAKC